MLYKTTVCRQITFCFLLFVLLSSFENFPFPLFGPLRKHASPTFRSTPTPLTKVHSGKVGRFSFDSAVSENTTDYRFNRMGTTARATGTNKRGYLWVRAMVFNTTFNDISIISWWSVLLVEETGVPGENHQSTFRK